MELSRNHNITGKESEMNPLYVDHNTGEVFCQEDIELKDGRRKWKERKKMAVKVAKLMSVYDKPRADNIDGCGTYLQFVRTPDTKISLKHANFCRERMCPMCQWRRSIKLGVQADKIYRDLAEKGYQHVFVTLTLRNCTGDELARTVDHLVKSAQRWRRHKAVEAVVRGAYRALEITYNEEADTYHPHIHALLTVPSDYFQSKEYITHEVLMETWKTAADLDYDPSVSIEAVKQKPGQTITSACAELCKYPAKTAEINSSRVLQYIDEALRGRRLIQWSGVAQDSRRELALDDVEHGNLVNMDDQSVSDVPLEEVVYIWRYGFYVPLDIERLEC